MSPLSKRFPRELKNSLGKYVGIFALMVVTISLTTGFLAAAASIQTMLEQVRDDYDVEDGNFTSNFELEDDVISQIEALGLKLYPNYSYDLPFNIVSASGEAKSDGESASGMTSMRVYTEREGFNESALAEGARPSAAHEIAIDRVFAANRGLEVGDRIEIGGNEFTISGIVTLPDYQALFEKSTDFIFNAITFSVSEVTPEGFALLTGKKSYTYSFLLDDRSMGDEARIDLEDRIGDILEDNGVAIADFVDCDANQGIGYALDDVMGDQVMWRVLLVMIIVIMAFVFVVLTGSAIESESAIIGTLLASGYRKRELVAHYLAMPATVGICGAIVGNIVGYAFLTDFMRGLYYNSYSIPPFENVFSPSVFVLTTVVPLILLVGITILGLMRKLHYTPLQFLRHDIVRRTMHNNIQLPERLGFSARFRLRVFLRNIGNFATLFFGIMFASLLLIFGLCMMPIVEHYADNMRNSLVSEHQYTLKAAVELNGTPEQREAYAAAHELSERIDMSDIDENAVKDALTNLITDRVKERIEGFFKDNFDSTALVEAIKASGGDGYVGGMSVRELLSHAGIDLDALAAQATEQARAQALAQYGVTVDSPQGQAIIAAINVTPADVLANVDASSVVMDTDSMNMDVDDVDIQALVRDGILRSSYVDLTDCGLGAIDLATFDKDDIDEDDLDVSAIDFSGITQEQLGLGDVGLDGMTLSEFFTLVDKASDIDEDANPINTRENSQGAIDQAEKFAAGSLEVERAIGGEMETVTVYGIQENSRYWDIDVTGGKVVVGRGLADKCNLQMGESKPFKNKYAGKTYDLAPSDVWGTLSTTYVFMSIDKFNELFGEEPDNFNGYVSNEVLDIDDYYLVNDLTPRDMDKIGAQMKDSMGDMMGMVVVVAVLIYLILMYLLTKTIIDRSARSISYMKVFGYRDSEINKLYVRSISTTVIASLVICLPILIWFISLLVRLVFMRYTGNFEVVVGWDSIAKDLALGIVTYAVVAFLHVRRIKRVPLSLALKVTE